jgi:HK97 family phage major capsid protein
MANPLSPSTPNWGGTLTREDWDSIVYLPLIGGSSVMSIPGLNVHQSNVPLHLPQISTPAFGEGNWVAPNTPIAETDLATSEQILLDRNIRALKIWTVMSNESVRSSDALQAGQELITARLVEAVDTAFLQGSSAAGITGLVDLAQYTHSHAASGDMYDEVVDTLAAAESENASPTTWLIHPKTIGVLRKLRSGPDNRPLFIPTPAQSAGVDSLLGRGVTPTPHMPVGTALLVDPSVIHVGVDLDGRVDIFLEALASVDQTAIRVVGRVDIKTVNAGGLAVLTGLGPPA